MTVEVLESTAGLGARRTPSCASSASRSRSALGPGVLGRVFNGIGQVDRRRAAGRRATGGAHRGLPLNPVARATPREFIETGITAIDLMNSLVRGQKLPLFSGGGLPHDRMAVEIAGNARLRGADGVRDSRSCSPAIGVPYDSAEYFRRSPRAVAARSSARPCSSTSPAIRRRSAC